MRRLDGGAAGRLVRIHARLRRLQLERLISISRREPALWLFALAVPIALSLLGWQGAKLASRLPLAGLLGGGLAFGGLGVFAIGHALRQRSELALGPLGHLATSPGMRALPPMLDAAVLWSLAAAPVLSGAGLIAPAVALVGGATAVFGALIAAMVTVVLSYTPHVAGGPKRISTAHNASARGWLPPLTRAQWRRKAGPVPAWLGAVAILLVGGLAARLARQNAPEEAIDTAILFCVVIFAGATLGRQDGVALRILARTPRPLWRLLLVSIGPPLIATLLGALMAILVAGAPLPTALLALSACLAVGCYLVFCALHALCRPNIYRLIASVDLGLAAMFAAVFPPAAPLWLGARFAMAWKRAVRLRWLDH